MDKNKLNELNKAYEKACNDILKAFAEEYEVQVDEQDWVGGDVGGIIGICQSEYFLNFEDLLYMLNNNIPFTEFLKWWDYSAEVGILGLNGMNFKSWIKGAPRYKREQLDRLQALHKEIDELTEETIKDLEGY